MLDRDRAAKLEHVLYGIGPFNPYKAPFRSRNHKTEITHTRVPLFSSVEGEKPSNMVNVALKSVDVADSDLCYCKFLDNFIADDAPAQAISRSAAEKAAPRAGAQPE